MFEKRPVQAARAAPGRYVSPMTRGEVARRLGKSIATVRRLEGRVLFPTKRRNGRWWFDPLEVDQLSRNPVRFQAIARSTWFTARIQRLESSGLDRPWKCRAPPDIPHEIDGRVENLTALLAELLNALADLPPVHLVRAGIRRAPVSPAIGGPPRLRAACRAPRRSDPIARGPCVHVRLSVAVDAAGRAVKAAGVASGGATCNAGRRAETRTAGAC